MAFKSLEALIIFAKGLVAVTQQGNGICAYLQFSGSQVNKRLLNGTAKT